MENSAFSNFFSFLIELTFYLLFIHILDPSSICIFLADIWLDQLNLVS